MSNIVPVKKVAFGSKEFMWLRTDINMLMEERESIRVNFNYSAEYAERYRWLCGTIRALAETVYFVRRPRIAKPAEQPVPDINDVDAYAKYMRDKKERKYKKPEPAGTKLKPSGKATIGMKKTGGEQKSLF